MPEKCNQQKRVMDKHSDTGKLSELRLGITSDCVHFMTPGGKMGTDTHIFCRQINALAAYFKQVVICCPVVPFPGDTSYSEYSQANIEFIATPKVGGDRLKDKLVLLQTIPKWIRCFKELDNRSDLVYQRFPNNLNIPGFFYFYFRRKKVFATFTGSWDKDPGASFSTRFQRFLLNHFFRGPVWVYSNQANQKPHIIRSFSPSYSLAEWYEEEQQVGNRISRLQSGRLAPLNMISVGTLCNRKNHSYILKTCIQLRQHHIPFSLVIAGSGERMDEYRQFVDQNGLADAVTLAGSVHYSRLRELYRHADLVVQSPTSEPYGKVPIEGYFHGLIPVLSNTSVLAGMITNEGKRGFVFDLSDNHGLFRVLQFIYQEMPVAKKVEMINDGRSYVKNLTIDQWAEDYARRLIAVYLSRE